MEEIQKYPIDNYERARIMIEEARLKCQASLASCGKSLESLNVSKKTLNDTTQVLTDFKTKYNETMDILSSKFTDGLKPLVPLFRKNGNTLIYSDSRPSSISECVEILKGKKKIVFLTGAGISVASGIPTFRGVGAAELFQKNGVTYTNEQIDTVDFLKTEPEMFWERHFQFIESLKGKKENISHRKIQQLREFVSGNQDNEQKQQVILVTQNIDGLHNMAAEKSENKTDDQDNDYFQIHGNNNYLRCDNEKCQMYDKIIEYPETYQTYEELVCQQCKEQLRPNLLFFDESYDEIHYKTDTLSNSLENMDALICVGTMLETSFPADMVTQAIEKKVTIIEINLEPVIEIGGLILKGKAEDIVPAICDGLMSKKNEEKPKEKLKEKPNESAPIINNNICAPINTLKNPIFVKVNKIIAPAQPKGNQKPVQQKKQRDDNKKK